MQSSLHRSPSFLPGIAVASVWASVVVASLFAPDMVTGSEREHLPIAAILGWVQGAIATGFILMAAVVQGREAREASGAWAGVAVAVGAIWLAAAVVSVFSPEFVTGSDPTRLPLGAIIAPVTAAIATGFVAIYAAGSR